MVGSRTVSQAGKIKPEMPLVVTVAQASHSVAPTGEGLKHNRNLGAESIGENRE